ncbi:hypothetical protein BDR04DRAFT_1092926 [Suillus decipiens]|nr:hypothetical protein BDR04DRAFT_1092926 [Suillus decipiens]
MTFTSLTTAIISATMMAGVVLSVPKLHCSPGLLGCWSGDTYNNGNDFVYTCGPDGIMNSWFPCSCKNCCHYNGSSPFC